MSPLLIMDDKIILFLSRDDAELQQKIEALSPRLEIVTEADLEARPELVSELEIVYGGLPRELLPQAKKLRWLQNMGAGVNHLLPLLREAPADLVVTNVSGIHAEPITEHMFGMLLQVTRALSQACEQQKTRQWRGFDFGPHLDMISGKTLGLLGVGAIGTHAARVGRAFGMKTIGLRRNLEPHPDIETLFSPDNRLDFFAHCDVVMNTLPLTEKTRNFMAKDEFDALPDGAIVINTGRGATIDTEAMVQALRSNKLKAALLDVTEPEPLPPDHPLWTLPNVWITPHYSGNHPQYDERADAIFLDNLKLFLQGEPLHHVVDKAEGY